MSQIAKFHCWDAACIGLVNPGDPTDRLYVLHADHLASHAFDEEKERALFEAEHSAFRLARNGFGVYEVDFVSGLWFGWSACAKARAKAAKGKV